MKFEILVKNNYSKKKKKNQSIILEVRSSQANKKKRNALLVYAVQILTDLLINVIVLILSKKIYHKYNVQMKYIIIKLLEVKLLLKHV